MIIYNCILTKLSFDHSGEKYMSKDLITMKRIVLDLHLILNLVNGSTSFQTAESWTPICLPRFDNR